MSIRYVIAAVPLAALFAAPALAEATEDGAQHLTGVFQAYFGSTPGVVAVAPEGDAYRLTVDLGPVVALIPAPELEVAVTPLTYTLLDQGDGTWKVTEDQGFKLAVAMPGAMDLEMGFGSIVSEGVFDEGLVAFTSYEAVMTGVGTRSTTFAPDGSEIGTSVSSIDRATYSSTGSAGAAGGVDGELTYDATGYTQAMTFLTGPGMPPMAISLTSETYGGTGMVSGMRTGGILDLVAFFVANAAPEMIVAEQDALKERLSAGLPLFEALDFTGEMGGVTATTPFGPFTAESLGILVGLNGIVADGRFREAVTIEGLSIPPGVAPDWAAPLVPTVARFDFEVSRFNLAAPAATLIEAFDLTRPEPVDPMVQMQLLGGFLPEGVVDVELRPGSLANDIYALAFEGQISAGPGQMPVGSGRVTAQGLDEVQAALAAAPPEVSGQALAMLGLALGLAQPGPDGGMAWEIDATTPGKLMVNGVDLTGMMGAP